MYREDFLLTDLSIQRSAIDLAPKKLESLYFCTGRKYNMALTRAAEPELKLKIRSRWSYGHLRGSHGSGFLPRY